MNLKISLNYKFLKRDIVSKKQTHRGDKLVVISGEKEGGRSLGGENGNPLQYSCVGNPMDRGVATVYGSQSWMQLSMCAL